MPNRTPILRAYALSAILTLSYAAVAQQASPIHLEREITLPGVEGRIDHLSADVAGKRLFVSALGNNTVEVVDLAKGERTVQIKGLKEPQGVVYVPENHQIYVAGGGDGSIRSYDDKTFKPGRSVTLGEDADNLRYDAPNHRLLAGYGHGAIAVLGLDLTQQKSVSLPEHPESFQATADGKKIFVNLPDSHGIAAIDTAAMTANPAWIHLSASGNFPMTLNESLDRMYVVTRKPARLMVVNTKTAGIASWTWTVGDADDIFADPPARLIYIIGGEGFVDVMFVRFGDALVSKGRVPTAPGARTGIYVPEWKELIVAAPKSADKPARLLVFSTAS